MRYIVFGCILPRTHASLLRQFSLDQNWVLVHLGNQKIIKGGWKLLFWSGLHQLPAHGGESNRIFDKKKIPISRTSQRCKYHLCLLRLGQIHWSKYSYLLWHITNQSSSLQYNYLAFMKMLSYREFCQHDNIHHTIQTRSRTYEIMLVPGKCFVNAKETTLNNLA